MMSRNVVFGVIIAITLHYVAAAKVLEVGVGAQYSVMDDALADAANGDTIRLTTDVHIDCAQIRLSDLTIEGSGEPSETVLDGRACGGKAALVAQGNHITVRNLTISHIRVPDGNGAGIRAEGVGLVVDHVRFMDDQEGILAGTNLDSEILVSDSEFLRNGMCTPVCAHAIYVGHIKRLHVERSRFLRTRDAHHIKSRAARTEVIDCDLADGPTGTSSYQIELPNGGSLLVRGNQIEKGPLTSNKRSVISIGTEGDLQATPEIIVERNVFTLDGDYATAFVRNFTTTSAQVIGNTLPVAAVPLVGIGVVQ